MKLFIKEVVGQNEILIFTWSQILSCFFAKNIKSENVSGSHLLNCDEQLHCFFLTLDSEISETSRVTSTFPEWM